ncbi:putative nuclease HARBI1 isoform X2 [Topomyia yanbarensis]|uniref:putative nuclease HARBI1 isoform X2 n=1 Tax=Topomyia yanbarensis TaxID=2498891 RepID=UPI00273AC90D|nr:putative nuclease HARBI1 isoform X2 [Topomyia yanbarensis]
MNLNAALLMNVNTRKEKTFCARRADCENFKALYRFTNENVHWLTDHFLCDQEDTRGGGLSNFQKMKTFLRYVGVGEDIGIHQTTVCKIIWHVCQQIIDKSNYWIQFPSTEEQFRKAKNAWSRRGKIPNAIGAIDCTHVHIVRPHNHPDEFINRKGFASFNVQATCDANDIFTSIDCSWPGSVHDSRIWKNSDIHRIMFENTAGALLLGDEGYAIAPWIMTPYRNPDTQVRMHYNKIFCRERVVIERVFGQVKRRFPFLQNAVRMATYRVPSMILACFVLHNVAKHLKDEDFYSDEDNNNEASVTDTNEIGDVKIRGRNRRDAIAVYLSRSAAEEV